MIVVNVDHSFHKQKGQSQYCTKIGAELVNVMAFWRELLARVSLNSEMRIPLS